LVGKSFREMKNQNGERERDFDHNVVRPEEKRRTQDWDTKGKEAWAGRNVTQMV